MPLKTRSRVDDPDFTSDHPGTPSQSKSKSPKRKSSRARGKGAASKRKKTGTDAPGTSVQSPRLSSIVAGPLDVQDTPRPFNDLIIGGPGSSEKDLGGITKPATLPSAPLVSGTPGPSSEAGQGEYSLIIVSSPVESLVKSRLPLNFGKESRITIGRDAGNSVVIPDQTVSRVHAELAVQGGRVYLRDLNSTNGTFVYDGTDFQQVMGTVEVAPGTAIRFGTNTIVKLTRK